MTNQQQPNQIQPWVEKYRPKELQNVSHQNEIIATLQNAVLSNQLPHLLFYGPPGTGKTSVALALCKTLWSPSQWKRRVLELNASDERGISIVRDKIKHFASLSVNSSGSNNSSSATADEATTTTTLGPTTKQKKAKTFFSNSTTTTATKGSSSSTNHEDHLDDENNNSNNNNNGMTKTTPKRYPNPPFKIIILDEADTVTPDAQAALRRIIEANSRVTRFILICNYVTRIIEPLASRCAKFRFQSLPTHCMKDKLIEICQQEEECDTDTYTKHYIDPIIQYSNGDMRRAITTLQSVHTIVIGSKRISKGGGSGKNGNDPVAILSPSTIAEIVGVPSNEIVTELWCTCTNSLPNNRVVTYDQMHQTVEHILASGYSAQLLLSSLLTKLLEEHDDDATMNDDTTTINSGVTNASKLDELSMAQIAIRIAEAEKNMLDGADEYLQFMTVCSLIYSCCSNSKQL